MIRIEPCHADESEAGDVASILAQSVGNPIEASVEALIQSCASDSPTTLWAARCAGTPVGILRLHSSERNRCIITHVAVHPEWQERGIGRKLIEFIRDELKFVRIETETDDGAVGFYRSCGFEIEPLGERYPGVQRYRCVTCFE